MDHEKNEQRDGQTGIDRETERRNRENETGQQSGQSQQPESGQQGSQSEGGSGFVGSSDDQSSDYLTKGDDQNFAPEGQGASDSSSGTSDVETGQPTSQDSTLDDGADTSR